MAKLGSGQTRSTRYLATGPRPLALFLGVTSTLTFLGLWTLISAREWVKPLYLPTPWSIVDAIHSIQPNVFIQTLSTVGLILAGYLCGAAAGISVGLMLRHSFRFRAIAQPMIQSSRPVPPVAVMPFCILWFGFAIAGKVLFIALGVFLVVVIGVTDAIDQLNPTYLRVAASFGASNRRYLLYAALPGIGPSLLAPLRIAMSLAVSLAVISEYMGATQGLGYIINNAQTNFSTNTILLCTMLLGAIGSLLDLVVVQCHALVTSWAKTA